MTNLNTHAFRLVHVCKIAISIKIGKSAGNTPSEFALLKSKGEPWRGGGWRPPAAPANLLYETEEPIFVGGSCLFKCTACCFSFSWSLMAWFSWSCSLRFSSRIRSRSFSKRAFIWNLTNRKWKSTQPATKVRLLLPLSLLWQLSFRFLSKLEVDQVSV